jgi:DNA-binding MarR family transcriptional regulator
MLWEESRRRILEALAAAGFDDIRVSHWPVIQYPGPAGARPSELAARAGMSKQAINHLIRDLEKLGYLALRPDPSDSRARLVELTDRGEAMMKAGFEAAEAVDRMFESRLSARQRKELRSALAKLRGSAQP